MIKKNIHSLLKLFHRLTLQQEECSKYIVLPARPFSLRGSKTLQMEVATSFNNWKEHGSDEISGITDVPMKVLPQTTHTPTPWSHQSAHPQESDVSRRPVFHSWKITYFTKGLPFASQKWQVVQSAGLVVCCFQTSGNEAINEWELPKSLNWL